MCPAFRFLALLKIAEKLGLHGSLTLTLIACADDFYLNGHRDGFLRWVWRCKDYQNVDAIIAGEFNFCFYDDFEPIVKPLAHLLGYYLLMLRLLRGDVPKPVPISSKEAAFPLLQAFDNGSEQFIRITS